MGNTRGRAGKEMSENRGVDGKEFLLRAAVVAAAAVLVLFCVKIWIVDPLVRSNPAKEGPGVQAGGVDTSKYIPDREWNKEKVKIKYTDAPAFLGRYVETGGEIVSSYNSGKVCYLNFNKNYREYLSLVIFASNFNRFPAKPEAYYLGKKVIVEGRIKDYKGRLEIVLGSQDQIKVIP